MKYRVTYTYLLDVEVEAENNREAYDLADKVAPDPYNDEHGFCQQIQFFESDIEEVE